MKIINICILSVALFSTVLCGCNNDSELLLIDNEGNYKDISDDNGQFADEVDNDEIAEDFENPRLFYVVYVCGAVEKPGVYEFVEGSRIFDAILKAGGYSEDAAKEYINLAKTISDEEMIYVPTKEELSIGGINPELNSGSNNGSIGNSQTANSKININSASKEELMSIPGIGESKANAIISYRETNGRFSKTEDIMQISGIKDGLYNKVKDNICVK